MNAMNKIKKVLSLLLVFVLVATLLPMPSRAATTGREADTIFFATDRHEESSKLKSLLSGLQYAPGLVVLGGDHVNDRNSGSLASITSEIQSVYPGVQTFYTYAAHDPNVTEDSSNPYAYARTGEVYEGDDYYVYGVDQDDMQSSSSASTASANFVTWASGKNDGKVIFVMCHMPIHQRRGDNAGGATWLNALNDAAEDHDIVFLWGHNHTGESSSDTAVYYVAPGGSVTPQGGSSTTIQFTYMNAGYIKNGYATLAMVNDDTVTFLRHNTSGSVTATYTMTRQHKAAHTHSYSLTASVAATCTADGSKTYTCSCGDTYTETVSAAGHSYTSVSTGATCTESGKVTYTCTVCGDSYSETVAASGHSYSAVVTAPTCEDAGYTTYTCTVCGDSYTGNATAALGHTYETVTVAATCTEDGSVTYTCDCGDTYTEVIEATGEHVYETVTVAATCTQDGSVTYTCGCGDTYTETVTAKGHAYTAVVTAPTCEAAGYTTYTCGSCSDSYTADEVAALGHAYTSVVTAPTCENAGYTTYICACGDSYTADEVAALGHSYTAVVTAPSCENAGYTTYTCACGDSYTADEVAALGHSYSSVVTAPTCETAGYTTYTCTTCGDSYVDDTVAALGHSYSSEEVDGDTVYTCTTCGDTYTVEAVELSYDRVTKFTTGESYVIGVYSGRTCYALSHAGNRISAVKITVSNGEVTSDVTDDLLWDYSGGKLSYTSNGTTYYLYAGSSQSWWGSGTGYTTLTVSTSTSSAVSLSSNKLKVGSCYLRYNGGTIKGYRSGGTTYIFQQTEE